MKHKLISPALAVFALAFFCMPVFATDYAVDTSFRPVFSDFGPYSDPLGDVLVQPDGKVLIGGPFYAVNGEASNLIVRLNADGTRDTSFTSPFVTASGFINRVSAIRSLPGGKLLVTGDFKIGDAYSSFVKLNSDGSIDNSMPNYDPVGHKIEPLADGKFIVCGGRLFGNETYWLAHRLNADGSPDPAFRVTIGEGSCQDIAVLPDGKILLAGFFYTPNNAPLRGVQRLHPDGTLDTTFNLATTAPHPGVREIAVLPDGKVAAAYCCRPAPAASQTAVNRFNKDGSLDLEFNSCGANTAEDTAMFPLSNGNILVSGCRKWQTGGIYQFAEMRGDGTIEPSLDRLDFDRPVTKIKSGVAGEFFAVGRFTKINDSTQVTLARLKPYVAPIKPKFDFDGDGKADLSVFRPSDRHWYLNRSTAGFGAFNWGLTTDRLIAANYDSDDKTDIGIYRNDGRWLTWTAAGQFVNMAFGVFDEGEVRPFAGDFDGDKKQDWAVRRSLNGSVTWLVSLNAQRGTSFATLNIPGETGITDRPVIGDFDGDSRDDIGYFRDGLWSFRDYGSGAPLRSYAWGSPGDIPLPGDYDGDGTADFAIFRPATGDWWINRSRDGVFVLNFGLASDIPVPADYDGDSKLDIAIYRNGEWWQYLTNGNTVRLDHWGLSGDIPVPAQAQ